MKLVRDEVCDDNDSDSNIFQDKIREEARGHDIKFVYKNVE